MHSIRETAGTKVSRPDRLPSCRKYKRGLLTILLIAGPGVLDQAVRDLLFQLLERRQAARHGLKCVTGELDLGHTN
jgi:hypothetical protein